jgi:nucleoside-diphosphate-sugar epimerase
MRIFLTGATGFIGSRIVSELIGAGHRVLGLSRSEVGAKALAGAGAEVHRGDLNDLESLRQGALACDGVIHTAFVHDFSRFQEVCELDDRVIRTLGRALMSSGKPLIVTSGTGITGDTPGRPASEDDPPESAAKIPRVASERAAASVAAEGVRVGVVRLPQVHDTTKQGLISYTVAVAHQKGVSAYVGEGRNRWPAVHVSDAARLYRLALERLEPGARYHAVAEEGISLREIAEVIGRGLQVPVISLSGSEAAAHFGWLAAFVGRDLPASSAMTRERLAWEPTGPTLLTDLSNMNYATEGSAMGTATHAAQRPA